MKRPITVKNTAKNNLSAKNIFFLKIILVLSIIGLITSIYLIENHYAGSEKGSFCDINAQVSCSLVNTSIYSELFNVSVAVFGALWFVVLIFLTIKSFKEKEFISALLGWSASGLLFIIYMIIAEIILKAICPFCTLVHIIVLAIFILSILTYKNIKIKSSLFSSIIFWMKKHKSLIALIITINLVPLIIFNWPQADQDNYDELAKCMTENGVKMYSSFRCGVCAKTREMFGDSFQYIHEIECHPQGENPQTELCLEKNIAGTPTWVLQPDGSEVRRHQGFLSIEELRQFSGCDLDVS